MTVTLSRTSTAAHPSNSHSPYQYECKNESKKLWHITLQGTFNKIRLGRRKEYGVRAGCPAHEPIAPRNSPGARNSAGKRRPTTPLTAQSGSASVPFSARRSPRRCCSRKAGSEGDADPGSYRCRSARTGRCGTCVSPGASPLGSSR